MQFIQYYIYQYHEELKLFERIRHKKIQSSQAGGERREHIYFHVKQTIIDVLITGKWKQNECNNF